METVDQVTIFRFGREYLVLECMFVGLSEALSLQLNLFLINT